MPLRLFATILVSLALLSGCGRRGPLESPAQASAEPQDGSMFLPVVTADSPPSEPQATRNSGPDRPFILDPLL